MVVVITFLISIMVDSGILLLCVGDCRKEVVMKENLPLLDRSKVSCSRGNYRFAPSFSVIVR